VFAVGKEVDVRTIGYQLNGCTSRFCGFGKGWAVAIGVGVITLLIGGCSSLNIDSAKQLGVAGTEASSEMAGNIYSSDAEYQRAMDAEALFYGFSGMSVPAVVEEKYAAINRELVARLVVFSKLQKTYEAFKSLAAVDAGTGMEAAINDLAKATNEYAVSQGGKEVVSTAGANVFAWAGGITAKEIQKRKIEKASVLIRERLQAFSVLFKSPLVKTQIVSFREVLSVDSKSAVNLLWKKNMFDVTGLVDDIGSPVGLKSTKEVAKIVADDQSVRDGLGAIVLSKAERRVKAIEKSYDAGVEAIDELINKHKELEAGEEINLSGIRKIIAELKRVADQLGAARVADN
jgi:hypothetical protein